MEQRTPEWFSARKGRLTASMAGAALGLAPYQSEDDCFRALVRSMHDMPSEFEGNVATEYGTAMEDLALRCYEMETGNKVDAVGFIPLENWAGASPDGLVGDDTLLEIKCPFGLRKDKDPQFKSLEDQPHYYAQIQMQLFVTERPLAHFWQWNPYGHSLEVVRYDGAWLNANVPKLHHFWQRAMSADPADFEGPRRKVIDTPEASKLVDEYDELSDAIDNATQRKKEIIARMVQKADGKNALVSGRNLTLVRRKGAVSYAKALKTFAPDADLEPFRGKESESWQLK